MKSVELRRFTGELLRDVLVGKISVLEATSKFPKEYSDKSLDVAFHALVHFEADEDIRKKDALYAQEQDDYIEIISDILLRGEDLPQNIIAEYEKYYPETLLYQPETRENLFKKLKKFINL